MLVPKLRFKREDGSEYPEWTSKHISEFANCFAGATPSTKVKAYWENGTISWLSSGEVNKKQIFETDKKISQLGFEKCSTKMVKPNSVVMALAGQGKTRGTVAITRIPVCTNQSLCAIETDDSIVDDYLYQYLGTRYDDLRNISSGDGTRGGLNLKLINNYLVSVPCLEEQQKIADFLSTVDEVIAQSEAEVQNLEQQKKAAMQKIFSQEVRFKREDGTDYPEWEEKKLGELLQYEQPTKYIVASDDYTGCSKYPVLTAGKSFILGYTDETDGVYNKGDVIIFDDFTCDSKYVDFEFKVKSSAMKMLTAVDSNHSLKLIFELMNRIGFEPLGHQRHWISTMSQETIIIPSDIEEQQKIADFLSTVDKAISYAKQELEHWKQLKKGLLQQMFV